MLKRADVVLYAIVLYAVVFGGLMWLKPACLFDADGSIRAFGIGTRRKTVLPAWLVSIVLGLLSYVVVGHLSRNVNAFRR
jgi:hypothetical protein